MHITLVMQHERLEVILPFCDLGSCPDVTRHTLWLNRFTQKPVFSYKTTWKPLHNWWRLPRHPMFRKCFGATGGSRGGDIRLPSPPLPLLCLPIFLLKNHAFSQFWAPLPLPLNLGLDSTLDPARRFWRVNGAQKCAKRYFYSKSRGKGGKLRVWTGTIVPFSLHLTPTDPVGGGGEISRDPEAKKVHFTPPKAKSFCHLVLKILFIDSPSPKCWFSQPHKLSSDICLRAQ